MADTFLLTGGARSGKSQYALTLAMARPGPRAFVATAEAFDEEMRERIAEWFEKVGDVVQLLSAGVITPSAEDERAIRQALELPAPTRAAEVRSERERLGRTLRPAPLATPPSSIIPEGV